MNSVDAWYFPRNWFNELDGRYTPETQSELCGSSV